MAKQISWAEGEKLIKGCTHSMLDEATTSVLMANMAVRRHHARSYQTATTDAEKEALIERIGDCNTTIKKILFLP